MKKYLNDIICLLVFIFVVTLFFYPTILHGKLPIPDDTLVGLYHPWRDLYAQTNPRGIPFKNFLITDPVRQQIPWRKEAMRQWQNGQIPYWNPFAFSGTPLAANIQAAVFYPFNFFFLIFPFSTAWTLIIILEPLLSGIFLYVYLRSLKLQSIPSIFGAIAWSFSGFNTSWLTWGTIVHVSLWLPLILLAVDRIFEKRSRIWVLILAAALLFQFFAGHAQVSLYEMIITVTYIIWRNYRSKSLSSVFWLLVAGIIFLLISSVQSVPFLQFLKETSRITDFSSWQKEGWFVPWQHLVQFIAPDFFGNPTTLNYWSTWNYGELTGYFGIAPLLFALYALFIEKKDGVKFWGIVLFFAFLFMLPTPIGKIPYQLHLLIVSSLQPTRLMMVVDFSFAILAAYGLNDFLIKQNKRFWVPAVGVFICFLAAWIIIFSSKVFSSEIVRNGLLISKKNLYLPSFLFFIITALCFILQYMQKKKILTIFLWGMVGVTSFDLLRFSSKFTPFTPASYFYPDTKIISFLKNQQQPFRVMSLDARIFPPNVSVFYGIESIEGYDPIYSARYEEFIAASERGKANIAPPYGFNRIITPHNIDSVLLPLLNVKYVLSLEDVAKPFLKKVFQEGETRIYEYTKFLPRAFLADSVFVVNNKQQILDSLFQKTSSSKNLAIVEKSIGPFSVSSEDAIQISQYNVSSILMEVAVKDSRFLVVSNIFDPGWKVMIDGNKSEIYRVNYTFFGFIVPSGNHKVSLTYQSL